MLLNTQEIDIRNESMIIPETDELESIEAISHKKNEDNHSRQSKKYRVWEVSIYYGRRNSINILMFSLCEIC